MIALQVKKNGEIVFTVGVDDWRPINVFVMLQIELRGKAPSFDLNVYGSCKSYDICNGDSVRWKTKFLNVGDEVSIKIIETENIDLPIKRLKRKDLEKKYDPQYTLKNLIHLILKSIKS
ncbi:MAG: hypothetical protein ACI9T7_002188 [Oleiphilaceae bacterium]|jgi:hypothetical protein